ncbi:hypothetical protein BH24ACT14_BH24ACT14_19530 [soil metagenome]
MADPTPRLLLWGCAVAIEAVATYAGHPVPGRGRTTTGDYQVAGEHLVERFRLFFLIALGETVVTSSTAFTAQPVAPLRVTALIVAFTGTVAIWWIYFHRAEGAAFELLDDGDGGDHGGLGRLATYSLYGMIAGLIVAAVGDQLVIARPGGDTDAVTSVVLYAGPAMFLLAQSWFILKAFGRVPPSRPVALIAFAALAFATHPLPPIAAAAGAAVVLVGVAIADTRRGNGASD